MFLRREIAGLDTITKSPSVPSRTVTNIYRKHT